MTGVKQRGRAEAVPPGLAGPCWLKTLPREAFSVSPGAGRHRARSRVSTRPRRVDRGSPRADRRRRRAARRRETTRRRSTGAHRAARRTAASTRERSRSRRRVRSRALRSPPTGRRAAARSRCARARPRTPRARGARRRARRRRTARRSSGRGDRPRVPTPTTAGGRTATRGPRLSRAPTASWLGCPSCVDGEITIAGECSRTNEVIHAATATSSRGMTNVSSGSASSNPACADASVASRRRRARSAGRPRLTTAFTTCQPARCRRRNVAGAPSASSSGWGERCSTITDWAGYEGRARRDDGSEESRCRSPSGVPGVRSPRPAPPRSATAATRRASRCAPTAARSWCSTAAPASTSSARCSSDAAGQGGSPVDGHLLIGHTHWDHIQGLPFFAPLFDDRNDWQVYGPRGLDTSIDTTLAGQMQYTYFPVQLLDFRATIEYHDLVEGQFQIDDVTDHDPLPAPSRVDVGVPDRSRRRDGRVLHRPRAQRCDRDVGVDAGPEGFDREDALHVGFVRDADLLIHDAQYLEEEYPAKVGWGHSTVEYAVDVAVAGRRRAGSRCSTTTRPAPTTQSTRSSSARGLAPTDARVRRRAVFAAAEGITIDVAFVDGAKRRTPIETATRAPALAELHRTVAIAVTDPDIEPRCSRPPLRKHFEALACRDLADGDRDGAHARRTPIVVLEAAPGRSLDDLAADAREVLAHAAGGRDRGLRDHHQPPGQRDPSRDHRLAGLAGFAVAPPHEAAGLVPPPRVPLAGRRRSRPTSPSGWRRSGPGHPRHRPGGALRPLHRGGVHDVRRAHGARDPGRRRAAVVQVAPRTRRHRDPPRRVDVRARHPRRRRLRRHRRAPRRPLRRQPVRGPRSAGCASTRAYRCRSPAASASARSASWTTVRGC